MPEASSARHRRFPTTWVALLLAVLVLAAFSPALLNDFVDYDDDVNFLNNVHYRGLGFTQLSWMFTTLHTGHWIPVTWVTLGLDYTLWGMNPVGYHLTNVLIHAINAALLYRVALRLLGTRPWSTSARHAGGMAAALFWALHPLRAESVAWVTERRDVLSAAFFLLAVLLYLRAHDEEPARRPALAGSLTAFALGIMSKSMVMTLPVVLIILDVFPLARLRSRRPARAVLVEKVPYAILGIAAGALGYVGQSVNGAFSPLEQYPPTSRIAIAGFAYAFYVSKTLVPVALSPLYELPASVGLTDPSFAAAWAAVIAISVAAIALRHRAPVVTAAWAYYVVTLAPVSGIAHAGYQVASDRYTYLPSMGFALIAGVGVAMLVSAVATRATLVRAGVAATACALLLLGALTYVQVQHWRTTESLFTNAIDAEPACAVCHEDLGAWLANRGDTEGALREYRTALALRPDRTSFHSLIGMALLNDNRLDEALAHFEMRRAAQPRDARNLVLMGTTLARQQRFAEAERRIADALAIVPDHAVGRAMYGSVLAAQGHGTEGARQCQRATELDGNDRIVRFVCGRLLAGTGDIDTARTHLRELGRLDIALAARLGRELAARVPR